MSPPEPVEPAPDQGAVSRGEEMAQHFPLLAAHLEAADFVELGREVTLVRARAGDEVHRSGQTIPVLLFCMEGRLALRLGDESSPADLGWLPGDAIVGEVSFFDGGPATATVVCGTPRAAAYALDLPAFERLAARSPRAAAALCRAICATLATRLRAATERLDLISSTEKVMPIARPGEFDEPRREDSGETGDPGEQGDHAENDGPRASEPPAARAGFLRELLATLFGAPRKGGEGR